MDHIDFVSGIQPDQMNYADELSEFDRDVARVGRSLSMESTDERSVRTGKQRSHKRFQVNSDAFALIRPSAAGQLHVENKSMAEIACELYRSKPVRFGRIDNISMGGLLFRYIAGEERSNQSLVLDILVAESGFYLENLAFKDISDLEMDDELAINSFKMRLNRVQFEKLEPDEVLKLKHFVENFCCS